MLLGTVLSTVALAALPGPFLNGAFPEEAPGARVWSTEVAFPALTFSDPVYLAFDPSERNSFVLSKKGQIWTFRNDPLIQAKTLFLDFSSLVQQGEDTGALSFTFHPKAFSAQPKPFLYVAYSYSPAPIPHGPQETISYFRVSRFSFDPLTLKADPQSEVVLIQQYDRNLWHTGGALFFDKEGYLYVSSGDEGGVNGQFGNAQRIDRGLFAGVLRLDVDCDPKRSHPIRRQPLSETLPSAGWPASFSQGYCIPDTNPWNDPSGSVLEEFYAIGLRSPHSMAYDAQTDEAIIGDVGQGLREELNILKRGANYGWHFREGDVPGPGATPPQLIGTLTEPALSLDRATATAVIAGPRYRGAKFASELGGNLIYADSPTGTVWRAQNGRFEFLLKTGGNSGPKGGISQIQVDSKGNIYLCVLYSVPSRGGRIERIKVAKGGPAPLRLSQTGAFQSLMPLAPSASLLEFSVNSPLWSDGAAKQRWISLPGKIDNTSIRHQWQLPTGSVLVQTFEVAGKKFETRFLVRAQSGPFYGITYRWLDDESDALLIDGSETRVYLDPTSGIKRTWTFPSRAQCLQCHENGQGGVLGFREHQLNSGLSAPHQNFLLRASQEGLFTNAYAPHEAPTLARSVSLDAPGTSPALRLRSYLDANCASCHNTRGSGPTFDARFSTPWNLKNLILAEATGHNAGPPGSLVLTPEKPEESLLFKRLTATDSTQMPPIGVSIPDSKAIGLVKSWIQNLSMQDLVPLKIAEVRFSALSEVDDNPWSSAAELALIDSSGTALPVADFSPSTDSEETAGGRPLTAAFDGNPTTFWHTRWTGGSPPPPHWVDFVFPTPRLLKALEYLPLQYANNGRFKDYTLEYREILGPWQTASRDRFIPDASLKRLPLPYFQDLK